MAEALGLAEPPTVGSVVASDAFFPFPDGLLAAAEAGATAVIQPGGSVRDEEVIAAADDGRARDGLHRRAALPALMARQLRRAALVAALVVALDRATKLWVVEGLDLPHAGCMSRSATRG